jgi:hypothetical protein
MLFIDFRISIGYTGSCLGTKIELSFVTNLFRIIILLHFVFVSIARREKNEHFVQLLMCKSRLMLRVLVMRPRVTI